MPIASEDMPKHWQDQKRLDEVTAKWDKIYSRFEEDVNELIAETGGNLDVSVMNKKINAAHRKLHLHFK